MKKNKMFYTMLAGAVALSTIGSINVFAEDKVELPTKEETSKNEEVLKEETQAEGNYMMVSGKIESVGKEKDYYRISITNDDMGMIFTAKESVFVIDSKNGDMMSLDDLKEGMEITAVVSKLAPMTMSLPPMTPGAIGFVVGSENNIMTGYFDEILTNQEAKLALNIADDTKIVDMKGSKERLTQDSIKGQECLVLYGVTTRSIPAQTTPAFVMILNETPQQDTTENKTEEAVETTQAVELTESKEVETKETAVAEVKEVDAIAVTEPLELVPLRDTAEALGFQVTWEGNDKPVVLEKDGIQIEVVVGSKEYKKGDTILTSGETTVLKDSKIYIGNDIANEMK